jgi:hypothetical protein
MDDSKIYLSLAVNEDGQLVPCDQYGREVYGIMSMSYTSELDSISDLSIKAILHDFGTDEVVGGRYIRTGTIETMQQRALTESEVLSMNNHLIERFDRNLADMKRKAAL